MNVNESDFLDGVSRALQAPEALKGLEDLQALRTAASYSPPEVARARSALLDAVEAVLKVKRKHGEAFEPLPGAAPAYTGHSPAADKLRAELQDKPWMFQVRIAREAPELELSAAPLREKPTLFESWQTSGGLQSFTPEQTRHTYALTMQAEVYKDPSARALLAELPRALVEAVRLEWFPGVPLSRLLPEGDGE
jgi:hypothetical protein